MTKTEQIAKAMPSDRMVTRKTESTHMISWELTMVVSTHVRTRDGLVINERVDVKFLETDRALDGFAAPGEYIVTGTTDKEMQRRFDELKATHFTEDMVAF
jgi:hypothetical protein